VFSRTALTKSFGETSAYRSFGTVVGGGAAVVGPPWPWVGPEEAKEDTWSTKMRRMTETSDSQREEADARKGKPGRGGGHAILYCVTGQPLVASTLSAPPLRRLLQPPTTLMAHPTAQKPNSGTAATTVDDQRHSGTPPNPIRPPAHQLVSVVQVGMTVAVCNLPILVLKLWQL
jgi:hypothetical protein